MTRNKLYEIIRNYASTDFEALHAVEKIWLQLLDERETQPNQLPRIPRQLCENPDARLKYMKDKSELTDAELHKKYPATKYIPDLQ